MRNVFYSLVNFINSSDEDDVYVLAAKCILQNIQQIPGYTIVDVAKMCFTSTATISRLCRKLNYESFSDFKDDVSRGLNYFTHDGDRMDFDHQLPVVTDYKNVNKDLFVNHFENIIDNLRGTFDNLEYKDVEKIADKIYESNQVCFIGNYFTQAVSMQFQIELAYLGKTCSGMYYIQQQLNDIEKLTSDDVIIISSIAGHYMNSNLDMMRAIAKCPAYKIVISQKDDFEYHQAMNMILKVGTDHLSLIGKFSITYIFELLEAIYHLKYA